MLESSDRKEILRETLVGEVNRTVAPSNKRLRLVATIAAIALASGTTGALSAAALSEAEPYDSKTVAALAASVARPNSVVVGQPFYISSTDTALVSLGSAPDGATGIAIRATCVEPGSFDISLDSTRISRTSCDSDSPTGGGGGVTPIADDAPHSLSFTSPGGTGYEAWIVWVKEPPIPTASRQQQEEIADGTVTRDEYLAAFNRFSGCMAGKGFDIMAGDSDSVIIQYAITDAAHRSGADELCYESQFRQVDGAWQIQNEDTSETTQRLRDCLADRGISPADRRADIEQQLADNGISFEECIT